MTLPFPRWRALRGTARERVVAALRRSRGSTFTREIGFSGIAPASGPTRDRGRHGALETGDRGFALFGDLSPPDPHDANTESRAADDLEVDPPSCIVIEDSPVGIEAARAAGARVLGLTTTHDPSDLQGAELLVRDLVGIEVRRRGGDFVLAIDL